MGRITLEKLPDFSFSVYDSVVYKNWLNYTQKTVTLLLMKLNKGHED